MTPAGRALANSISNAHRAPLVKKNLELLQFRSFIKFYFDVA